MDNHRLAYLIASITDIQSTIRAIDTKIGVLVVFLIFPISNLDKIYTHLAKIAEPTLGLCSVSNILIFMFITIWLLSLLVILGAIAAIDNPSNHISKETNNDIKGSFYVGGAFDLGIHDVLYNRSSVTSSHTIEEYVANLPANDANFEAELTYEQLKLVYIREIKMHRFNIGLKLALGWLFLGFLIYVISKLSQ